ncbi:hypothetical protein ACIP5Y_43050 [Nocardia sp. NPDC088792]|uniref:hypothetical protein n=1 Tax=Nocardia sp. NPDC088792 TaxID=3364332 RepID=UPI003822F3A8
MTESPVAQPDRPRKRSRRVSYVLPATVAAALVSSGCIASSEHATSPTLTHSPIVPFGATTTRQPSATTAPAPTTTDPLTTTPTTEEDETDPTDVAICVDPESDVRVDDDLCDTEEDTHSRFWLHHSPSLVYPAVGAAVGLALGSFIRPTAGRILDRGVPAAGGRVLRGGFGGHSPVGG